MYLYSFILFDYVPWLRALDLEGHEKIVNEATRIINGYHDPIIDEREQQWREGKRVEAEDLLELGAWRLVVELKRLVFQRVKQHKQVKMLDSIVGPHLFY
ncbi:hypothetical protein PTKIN_Ptkin03bG0006200 [Pterospermum kingtungense]